MWPGRKGRGSDRAQGRDLATGSGPRTPGFATSPYNTSTDRVREVRPRTPPRPRRGNRALHQLRWRRLAAMNNSAAEPRGGTRELAGGDGGRPVDEAGSDGRLEDEDDGMVVGHQGPVGRGGFAR
ncbi:hypothetical protein AB7M49_003240 [Bradyrhizobium elkanii]